MESFTLKANTFLLALVFLLLLAAAGTGIFYQTDEPRIEQATF